MKTIEGLDITDYEVELWTERAAIIEFDGNMAREEAERRATEEFRAKKTKDEK